MTKGHTFTPAQAPRKYDMRALAKFLYEHCALDPDKAGEVAATLLEEYSILPDDLAAQPPAAPVETDEGKEWIVPHEDCLNCRCQPHERCAGFKEVSRSSAGNGDLAARAAELLSVEGGWGNGPALKALAERIGEPYGEVRAQNITLREALEVVAGHTRAEPQPTPETFRAALETAYRRSGGIPAIARSERGARKIIDIAVAEYSALSRPESK